MKKKEGKKCIWFTPMRRLSKIQLHKKRRRRRFLVDSDSDSDSAADPERCNLHSPPSPLYSPPFAHTPIEAAKIQAATKFKTGHGLNAVQGALYSCRVGTTDSLSLFPSLSLSSPGSAAPSPCPVVFFKCPSNVGSQLLQR